MSSEQGSRPSTGGGIKTIPLDPGLCRNITIHGFCKWADKGCRFNHGETTGGGKLRPDTPTFTPGGTTTSTFSPAAFTAAAISANATIGIGAPVFVPRTGNSSRTFSSVSRCCADDFSYASHESRPLIAASFHIADTTRLDFVIHTGKQTLPTVPPVRAFGIRCIEVFHTRQCVRLSVPTN